MDISLFLSDHNIPFKRFDHPAVFTCEEADKVRPDMPGEHIKNLFLRDRDGARHFLVVVGCEKRVDLKKLKDIIHVSKLSFGSEEHLQKYLGVTPGAVTLLGLIHDTDHYVEVIIDQNLMGKSLQCHPLVNSATLVISGDGIQRFLKETGHECRFLDIPER